MKALTASRMRLSGMIRKESLQILRDPSSIAIAFVMPVALLLLFGYGVSLDARHIPLAMVVEQPDTNTGSLVGAFQRSEYFDTQTFVSIQAAQQAFDQREVFGIVWLRNDFSEKLLLSGDAPIGVIVNGVDANQARITEGYIQGVWQAWLGSYARSQGVELAQPVALEPRIWFNAAVRSLDAGRVRIKHQDRPPDIPLEQPEMVDCQGCTQRGHGVMNTVLRQRHHIHIALDHDQLLKLA